jgi:hypothetical protein
MFLSKRKMINKIKLEVEAIKNNDILILEGIRFDKCSYIKLFIDDIDIRTLEDFEDVLIVFSELEESTNTGGKFLIFTCACGIADDGGWDYINVVHTSNFIEWSFSRGTEYYYKFDKQELLREFANLNLRIQNLKEYPLIPEFIVYPED